MRCLSVLAVLAVLATPALCSRPLDSLSSWITAQVNVGQGLLSDGLAADKPWFCHDLDCPKYKVTNHTEIYETRTYEKGRWASTHVQGIFYTPSISTGFKRLFEYISGENEDSTKIPMTAPVLTAVQPGQGPFCKSNFTVAFYVPTEFQENTPEPINKDVFLFTSPEGEFFVHQFGGFLLDDFTLSAKVKALREALVANKEDFLDNGDFFTASYDPPFRVQHRHNEIWIPKKKAAAATEALPQAN